MPKLRLDQLLSCILLVCISLVVPFTPLAEAKAQKPITQLEQLPLLAEDFYFPERKLPDTPPPYVSAKAVIVYDQTNGAIIYEKSIDLMLPEASLTKLMTALVSVELYDLNEQVTINNLYTTENNLMGLRQYEVITVENILKGLLIPSANDAAFALAHHHPQGHDAFISAMNAKARELHLNRTSFQNTPGFDETYHYSTAFDLAILGKEVLNNPVLASMMLTQDEVVFDVTNNISHPLHTTNQLLNQLPGLVAGKTGVTPLAGECLITRVDRNGHSIITVILGSKDRFKDTSTVVEWVYNQVEWKSPVQADIKTL